MKWSETWGDPVWRHNMLILLSGLGLVALVMTVVAGSAHPTCAFDRNELGPVGAHGQWWWDIYKCSDGTERRVLVAFPRG